MITLIFIITGVALFFIGHKESALLIVFGIIAKFLSLIFLGYTTIPGKLVAYPDNPKKQTKIRQLIGLLIIIIIQSIFYLPYTFFILGWTKSAGQKHPEQFLLWPLAILAIFIPIAFAIREFSKNSNEIISATMDMDERLKQVVANPVNKTFLMLRNATIFTLILTVIWSLFLLSK
jgi:hypothetical protein